MFFRHPLASLLTRPGLWLLAGLFLICGLIGHDPWKPEDAAIFGMVWHQLGGGGWLLPALADQSQYAAGPLFPWLATGFALLVDWLPPFDAARLASLLCAAASLAFTWAAARRLFDAERATAAVLLHLGSLGLLLYGHLLSFDLAGMAAVSFSLYTHTSRSRWAGALAGAAIGLGLLACGPSLALVQCLIHAYFGLRGAARINYWIGLGIVALALAGAWMGLAAWRAPAEFLGWWREVVPWARRDINWLSAADQQVRGLVWVTWPCWPLALWALYAWRGEWRITRLDGLALAAALLCILPVFVGEPRESAGLIALPPLALLATAGLERLRRGAANAFDWFGVMSLSFAAALVWLGWVAQIFEVPARIALNFGKLAPGFEAPWRPFAVIVAVAVSAAWLWLLRSGERSIYRGIVRWSAGVTVVWVLLVSLWMPWIDYTKTYRNPFGALHAAAPRTECVAGDRLGAPQRAMLHYFAGVVTRSPQQRPRCNWMLVKDDPRGPVVAPRGDWVEVWRGGRPGDRAEVYRLYQRDQCAAAKRKHRGSAETAPNCVPPQPVRRR